MNITQSYPVIQVEDVAKAVSFFEEYFGFRAQFSSDWYVHLQ